jgi:hypothetical protein
MSEMILRVEEVRCSKGSNQFCMSLLVRSFKGFFYALTKLTAFDVKLFIFSCSFFCMKNETKIKQQKRKRLKKSWVT